jgi:hypothetical protein
VTSIAFARVVLVCGEVALTVASVKVPDEDEEVVVLIVVLRSVVVDEVVIRVVVVVVDVAGLVVVLEDELVVVLTVVVVEVEELVVAVPGADVDSVVAAGLVVVIVTSDGEIVGSGFEVSRVSKATNRAASAIPTGIPELGHEATVREVW